MSKCTQLIQLAMLLMVFTGIAQKNLYAKCMSDSIMVEEKIEKSIEDPSAGAGTDNARIIVLTNRNTTSELRIRGRMQSQFAASYGSNDNIDADPGNYSSFEMRRVRLGVQGKLYGYFDYMVEANVLSNVDLDAATLVYTRIPGLNITFGKDKPQFGHEQNTSSANILTFERTRLDGHLNGGKPIGLRVHGSLSRFSFYLGVYNGESAGTGRMSGNSVVYLLNVSGGLNLDGVIIDPVRTRLRTDFLHRTKETGYYPFENAIAMSAHLGIGRLELRTEYMQGENKGDANISGFYIMPSWFFIAEKFQVVFRYEHTDGGGGLSVGHNRYADRITNIYSEGKKYEAFYSGFNYFIHGHNLKLMIGYERAENRGLNNTSGIVSTFFSGFRMQF